MKEDKEHRISVYGYEVRYENGSSHSLHEGLATSLEQAIAISRSGILGCLPNSFNPDNLVRPVIARRLGLCSLCGSREKLAHIELSIGMGCLICARCVDTVKSL